MILPIVIKHHFVMKDITMKYSNGEVTVVWKPALCRHSTICWKGPGGLINVFNPMKKPWIDPHAAPTERIIEQVSKCPSGALSYFMNEPGQADPRVEE
jgi:uncharacterized Fe-S cluster protein YjdI